MKEYLQTFKEYWSFILIAVYSIAYCYNYIYYSLFDINIFQYITLTDLLFFSIEQIIVLFGLLVLFDIIGILVIQLIYSFFINSKTKSRLKIKLENRNIKFSKKYLDNVINRYQKSRSIYDLLYFAVIWTFVAILFKYLDIPLITVGALVSAGFLNFNFKLFKLTKHQGNVDDYVRKIAFFLGYIMIIFMVGVQAFFSSEVVKNERDTTKYISFNYLGKSYNVDDKLRFVGETSTYIFLYNKPDETTLIFPKTKIDNLKINAKDSFLYNRVKNDK